MEKDQKQNTKIPSRQPGLGGMSVSPFDWEGGKTMKPPVSTMSAADPNAKTIPLDEVTYGSLPQDAPKPYGYYSTSRNRTSIGAGLLNYQYPNGLDVKLLSVESTDESFGDELLDGGSKRTEATLLDVYYGREKSAGIGLTIGQLVDEKAFGWNEGFLLESQATLASIQAHLGKISKDRQNDTKISLGASFRGGGSSTKGHWKDEDGDGAREYGFGGEIGRYSFDIQTEDPIGFLFPGKDDPLATIAPNLGRVAHMLGSNLSDLASEAGVKVGKIILQNVRSAATHLGEAHSSGENFSLNARREAYVAGANFGKAIARNVRSAATHLGEAHESAANFSSNARKGTIQAGSKILKKGLEVVNQVVAKGKEKASSAASSMGAGAKELFSSGKEKAKDLAAGGKNMVSNVVAAVKAAPAEIMQKAKLAPAAIVNTAKKAVAATKAAPAYIAEKAKQAPAAIANAGKQAVAAGTNLAKNAYNGGKQAVGSIWNAAKGLGSWLSGGDKKEGNKN
jgi:hypothetical protein